MFKETATDKLIEYIHALPAAEQEIIASKITKPKKKVVKKADLSTEKEKIQAFINYIKDLPARLPADYKFNREEANER